MVEQAIQKIENEMATNKDNSYIQAVGGFLLSYVKRNAHEAGKILNEEKTIVKSLDEMRKEATKKKVGNVAVLTDEEGFAVVLKYYGIEENPATSSSNFDVSLDELLGG